jgi:hypothetical protein
LPVAATIPHTAAVGRRACVWIALLGIPRAVAAHEPAPSVPAPSDAIAIVVLDSASIDDELRAELELRTGGRSLAPSDTLVDVPSERFAWVGVSPSGSQRLLEVVLSDGRAYSRLVDAPPGQLARATAGALVNMLDAIEDGRLAPERTGVAVPLVLPTAEPPPPAPTPAPIQPSPIRPSPSSEPTPPTWWLGPRIGGEVVFGVGPPVSERGLVAGGATLGVDAMHRRGGLVAADVRVAGRSTDALQVLRIRVALGGGWVLRRGRFALPLRAAISIEPLVSRGATLRDRDGASASPRPLVGGLIHGSPSVVWWLRSGRAAVRASIELELAASMEARAKPGVVRYVEAGDTARGLGRVGGVELAAGLGVGAWFAVDGRSAQANRAARVSR